MEKANIQYCVVTGGASGIGKALCEHLASAGAKGICVVDMNKENAQKVAVALPCNAIAVSANCGVEMDLRKVVNTAWAAFGGIDAWFSNAGIPSNGGINVPNDEWDRIWRVNSMQHVWSARHLFPRWKARGKAGSFVITASAAGLLTQVGSLPYSVTKHAAVSMAEWLAITHKDDGIKIHCLCPQAVQTGMMGEPDSEMSEGGPAGGDGVMQPEDVAAEVLKCMNENKFLILPHKEVAKYMQRKATDYDRWLNGMGRMHSTFGKFMLDSPGITAAKL